MEDPIVVEITRGSRVESRHRASAAVVDADGATVFAFGDQERPIFPRSAVKAIQALPLVESGIADRYGLTDAELALACASHSESRITWPQPTRCWRRPGRRRVASNAGALADERQGHPELAASGGTPGALHNNCSGKHAGFVCLACGLDEDPRGYVREEHRVQQTIRGALEDLTGASHTREVMGTDGCSIPTYAIPLPALAFGFAKFGTGIGISRGCAAAAKRIRAAVAKHPFMVAGTGRFDTRLMSSCGTGLHQDGGRGRLLRGPSGARVRSRAEGGRRGTRASEP
jgi:L-asparaginase II